MARVLLGISPGTRSLGLAVLSDGELVEWKVKTFKEPWSWSKRAAILAAIEKICAYHGVKELALKKIDPSRSSWELDRLVAAIKRQCRREGVYVWQYSLSDLDYESRSARKDLSDKVAEKHPQLRSTLDRERSNRNEYHTKMFEAVAIAERCHDQ